MTFIHSYIKPCVILVCFALLSGCANFKEVGRFAEGAQALSEASDKFYTLILQTDWQLAAMTVDLSASTSAACGTPWDCATGKGQNLIDETRRHRAAIQALAEYAQSLNELAQFEDDKEIEKSSQKLSTKLQGLAGSLGSDISDTKSGILSGALSSLAESYVDAKAKKVIQQKIAEAHPHVSIIVEMLVGDIKRQRQRMRFNQLNADATREGWYDALSAGYQDQATPAADKAILQQTAGILVANAIKQRYEDQAADEFFTRLEGTAQACLAAHAAIGKPDIKDQARIVFDFAKDARDLLKQVIELAQ